MRSHVYYDKDRNPLFRTVKRDDERWQQERCVNGEWVVGLGGMTPIPYRLPDILDVEEVWLCEGEKDADTLVLQGKDATSLPMGTHKWRQPYAQWFQNKTVNVVQDNDEAGVKGAEAVCGELRAIGCTVRLLKPPDDFKDVTDSGGALDLIEEDEPFWFNWNGYKKTETAWLVKPIIPAKAYVMFYGGTESSKSMFALWCCAQMSWNGKTASYYSLENSEHTDKDRLDRIGPDSNNFRITHAPLDLSKPRQVEALIEREKGRNLIVIDSYGLCYPFPDGDPNESVVEFSRIAKRIIHTTGASFLIIDHVGYQNSEEPRGASAKRQQVDIAVLFEKDGEWKGLGQIARFTAENKKVARYQNPFKVSGGVRDDPKDQRLSIYYDFDYKPQWPDESAT